VPKSSVPLALTAYVGGAGLLACSLGSEELKANERVGNSIEWTSPAEKPYFLENRLNVSHRAGAIGGHLHSERHFQEKRSRERVRHCEHIKKWRSKKKKHRKGTSAHSEIPETKSEEKYA
jgi:hypothetical protein